MDVKSHCSAYDSYVQRVDRALWLFIQCHRTSRLLRPIQNSRDVVGLITDIDDRLSSSSSEELMAPSWPSSNDSPV